MERYKALDPASDIILAFKQNGRLLTPDHGYPLRIIIPGAPPAAAPSHPPSMPCPAAALLLCFCVFIGAMRPAPCAGYIGGAHGEVAGGDQRDGGRERQLLPLPRQPRPAQSRHLCPRQGGGCGAITACPFLSRWNVPLLLLDKAIVLAGFLNFPLQLFMVLPTCALVLLHWGCESAWVLGTLLRLVVQARLHHQRHQHQLSYCLTRAQ